MAQAKIFNLQPVSRKLDNWLSTWLEYTADLPSPVLWRRWAGISLLAGVMERKVFTKTAIGPLYPNLYTVIVGPPGTGKTAVTSEVWRMWADLADGDNGFHLASSSLTSASIVDDLREAKRSIIKPDMSDRLEFNSLAICSNELGVLLPEYDSSFMSKLTDIYDGHPYSERRRTKELNFKIENPQINLLAATTPSYLNNMLPEGAWEQGFLSRTLLVFSTETMQGRAIFAESKRRDDLRATLLDDLRIIFSTIGKMGWEPDAAAAIQNWSDKGAPPVPEHPKLLHYTTRRIAHVLKLCMVASMARGVDLMISKADFDTALDWLLELEAYMPDIFKSMVVGGDSRAMEECWYYCLQEYAKHQRPIAEGRIIEYLGARIPAFNVGRVLDVMIRGGLLIEQVEGVGKFYKPRAKKP